MKKLAQWHFFAFWDRTGIQHHLEEMAAKGWMLERIGLLYHYRRCTPGKYRFCVTYYPDADPSDPAPTEGEQDFQALVSYAGWELAATNAQMQIFCTDREDVVPIETDPVLEVENIHRAMKPRLSANRSNAICGLVWMVYGLLQCLTEPVRFWSIPLFQLISMFFLLEVAESGSSLLAYSRWRRKARKAAEEGEFLATPNLVPLNIAFILVLVAAFALYFAAAFTGQNNQFNEAIWIFLLIPIDTVIVIAAWKGMKRLGVAKQTNKMVLNIGSVFLFVVGVPLIIVLAMGSGLAERPGVRGGTKLDSYRWDGTTYYLYLDELPLKMEDLQPDLAYDGYVSKLDSTESFFAGSFEAEQSPRMDDPDKEQYPTLEYECVTVKWKALWSLLYNDMYQKFHRLSLNPVSGDPVPWDADQAWTSDGGECLLCYGDTIVFLRLPFTPTEAQMQVIGAAFGGN